MELNYIWLLIGSVLIFLEVIIAPGIGFLFSGLASITLGALITFGVIDDESSLLVQLAIFFALTILWAIILWRPLKKLIKKNKSSYDNLVGTQAIIANNNILKGEIGEVIWSGTTMRAKISSNSVAEIINVNSKVVVLGQEDGVLIIDTKK
jgi:membrane protein implicated in regulation of membrane protease activity